MPTPFMHLQTSDLLRTMLQDGFSLDADLRALLATEWPAFYFGSMAPDYQTIAGIPRSNTHFYGMPPQDRQEAVRNMLAQFPALYPGRAVPSEQAAFLAGYLMHLQMDLDWHFDVVVPVFVEGSLESERRLHYLLHIVLLTVLDHRALEGLPDGAADQLASAAPGQWLPFADDRELSAWRDFLVPQMQPLGAEKTIEIFSGRVQMTPAEFAAKLNDRDWMDSAFFSRVPVDSIEAQMRAAVPRYRDLIQAYWVGELA